MSRLTGKQKLFYGFGGVASSAYQVMVMSYLTFFYTDVFGLSAAAVGTLMLVSRLWDGINDPVMGVLLDKTKTRWGRFRPYMLIVSPFLGLSFVFLFTTPNFGPAGKLAYAYITYIIYVALYTMYDIASSSLAPALSRDRNERKSLISIFRLIAALGACVAIFTMPAVKSLGGDSQAAGFRYYAIIIAAICIAASQLSFFKTKEAVKVDSRENLTARKYIELLKSRPLMLMLLFILTSGTAASLQSGLNIHYIMHFIGRPELIPILTLAGLVTYIAATAMAEPISKLVSPRQLFLSVSAAGLVLLMIKFFMAKESIAILITITIISGLIGGISVVYIYLAANDIIDFIEFKHQKRVEGFTFSLIIFIQKLAMALGGALAGFVLAFIRYQSQTETQSAETLKGINAGINLLPILIMVISMVIIRFYNLADPEMKQITAELENRRKKNEILS